MSALFNISYGLYVLTTNLNKYNGCIINTLMQVTSNPNKISITLNKENFTTKTIEQTKEFNVSILDTTATFDVFKRFGFSSGESVDKFKDFYDYKLSENNIPYITKHSNAYISAKVVEKMDVGTHVIFIAEIVNSEVISTNESLTYSYYHKHIKPSAKAEDNSYVCKICGYVHNGNELPNDFVCPICKHGAEVFEKQSKKENAKKKYVCPICGYAEESETEINSCIICGAKMLAQ